MFDQTSSIEEVMIKRLSRNISKKSAVKMGQLQIELSQSYQVQMKTFLSLNCMPKSLVSNTINCVQKFQVTKKLSLFY